MNEADIIAFMEKEYIESGYSKSACVTPSALYQRFGIKPCDFIITMKKLKDKGAVRSSYRIPLIVSVELAPMRRAELIREHDLEKAWKSDTTSGIQGLSIVGEIEAVKSNHDPETCRCNQCLNIMRHWRGEKRLCYNYLVSYQYSVSRLGEPDFPGRPVSAWDCGCEYHHAPKRGTAHAHLCEDHAVQHIMLERAGDDQEST